MAKQVVSPVPGGEPLLQGRLCNRIVQSLPKAENISTCLDTAGYGNGSYDALLDYTDLVIFDIKHMVPENYHELTGGRYFCCHGVFGSGESKGCSSLDQTCGGAWFD